MGGIKKPLALKEKRRGPFFRLGFLVLGFFGFVDLEELLGLEPGLMLLGLGVAGHA
jgi:hypothetical protein